MSLRPWHMIIVAALAAGAGFAAFQFIGEGSASEAVTTPNTPAVDLRGDGLVGQRRPDYTLGSVDGSIVSADEFDGQVVLVNFWATWCAPCREEMPMLMAFREDHRAKGVEVVGIAIDDVAAARGFVDELGIEYPNLVGSTDVMATIRLYGNASGALPYTVLVDSDGIVRWTRMGVLEEEDLESRIQAILDEI